MPKLTPVALCILLFMTGASCCSTDPLAPAPGTAIYNYNWGFVNLSSIEVSSLTLYLERNGARVYFGRDSFLRQVPPGGWGGSTFSSINTPLHVPDHVIVVWSKTDGSQGEQSVSLIGLVPPGTSDFKGTVWLRYYKGSWHPAILSEKQTQWQLTHGQGNEPQGLPS